MSNRIVFVQDSVSAVPGAELMNRLMKAGVIFEKSYTIPIQLNASEEEIVHALEAAIDNANVIFGISSSGNGIAIYGNKIEGIKAAPISTENEIDEAVSTLNCNMFDVSSINANAFDLYLSISEKLGII